VGVGFAALLQAVVQVDEEGTEAAAVTSVIMTTRSVIMDSIPPLVSVCLRRAQQHVQVAWLQIVQVQLLKRQQLPSVLSC
jgi:hypothetical protein